MAYSLKKKSIFEKHLPSCHASSLVKLHEGFLVSYFAGSEEGKDDVNIYISVKEGNRWQAPLRVSSEDNIPYWNPVAFDLGDRLALYFKKGKTIPSWQTFVSYSYDGGKTFSKEEILCQKDIGGRGPVKNKPIYLKDGSLLAPASTEIGRWRAFVDISYDNGNKWEKSNEVPVENERIQLIQPSLFEDHEGVHMLIRSNQGKIYRSDSDDGGKNWSLAYPIDVDHNHSGIDLVKVDDSTIVLACNPVKKGRSPLTLLISNDKGYSFSHMLTLEDGDGEFSYPSIIADNNRISGVYTYKREKIVFFQCQI